ncbi:hypothetical protein M2323_001624 [Rhodoblastus acidophilus]|nr:hypothetical protein [Rhodoblastus acidophilus]
MSAINASHPIQTGQPSLIGDRSSQASRGAFGNEAAASNSG